MLKKKLQKRRLKTMIGGITITDLLMQKHFFVQKEEEHLLKGYGLEFL